MIIITTVRALVFCVALIKKMQSSNTPHILPMICEAVVLLSAIAIHCKMKIETEMFYVPMSYIVVKTLVGIVGQKTDGQRIEIFLNLIIFILFALNFVEQ